MIPALCQHPTYFQLIALSPDVPIVITRNALSHSQVRESISTTHAVRIIGTGATHRILHPLESVTNRGLVCIRQKVLGHLSINIVIYEGRMYIKKRKGVAFGICERASTTEALLLVVTNVILLPLEIWYLPPPLSLVLRLLLPSVF